MPRVETQLTDYHDQDDGFTLVVSSRSVERESFEVTGRLPAGSSYTISQQDSTTVGISTTASLEAGFFDIFSASVGVTVSSDYTVTSGTSVTISVDCDPG